MGRLALCKGEGRVRVRYGATRKRVSKPLTFILSPAEGRGGKTGCGFVGMGAGLIKVPEMDLIALLLKRPFHTGVC